MQGLQQMFAVRVHEFGGSGAAVYEKAPVPQAGAGEVLIRVHAASVNPVDWKTRQGYLRGAVALPMTLGWDVAGVVEQVGAGVEHVVVGDEVYAMIHVRGGAFAEYAVARAVEVARKPATLSMIDAAGVPLAALTAWQALQAANLTAGQTVLIHGAAGGVGLFAVQFAKLAGAQVIGTARSHNQAFVRQFGADQVIDYRATPFEQAVQNVDVVLDAIGGETLARSWSVLKPGGLLASIVDPIDPAAIPDGLRGARIGVQPDAGQLAHIAGLLDAGQIRPATTLVLPLSAGRLALDLSETGRVRGKLVLEIA
jgi:NADPH:quinone reductase-like Zn-dependent oxidoreductase